MIVTITGASDDLIEIEGAIVEEFSWYGEDDEPCYLAVSDGTLLSAVYDKDGIWRFALVERGTAKFSKVEGVVSEDTNDVVTLDGDRLTWVVQGKAMARADKSSKVK